MSTLRATTGAYVPRHRRQQQAEEEGHRRQAALQPARDVVPRSRAQRKLLILDINNVLLARQPYTQRGGGGGQRGRSAGALRGARPRPYLESFLAFCAEDFELAVWSCGRRGNMEMELFRGARFPPRKCKHYTSYNHL